MCEIKLYNFYIGDLGNVNKPQYEEKRFGSLKVRFCGDYMEQITQLKQMEKHKCVRGFIHTADLLVDKNAKKQQKSILLESPSDNNGIFDFLELATFFTGRRVVAENNDDMNRYYTDIQKTNSGCHYPFITLHDAWENRHCLVDSKIGMALLLMNSVRSNILQSMVYHYASAMEIIQTQLSKTGDPLDINHADIKQADKNTLKEAINKILKNSTFSEDLKNTYKRIIGSRIDQGTQGPRSARDFLLLALKKLAILEGEPSKKSQKAIRIINEIRNKIMHTGKFSEIHEHDSSQYGGMQGLAMISGSIIPRVCIIAICKTLKVQEIYYDSHLEQVKYFFKNNDLLNESIENLLSSPPTS